MEPLGVPASRWPGSQEREASLGANQRPLLPSPPALELRRQQCSRHAGPASGRGPSAGVRAGQELGWGQPGLSSVSWPSSWTSHPHLHRQDTVPA